MSDTETSAPPSKKQKLDQANADRSDGKSPENMKQEFDFTEDVNESGDKGFSMSDSKYCDIVSAEEIEKLKEFQVLDEVKSDDEDSEEEESDSSEGKSEGIPEEEIEKMLDEDLPEGFKGSAKPKEKPYHTRQKTVLEEKGINYFEVLPLDWTMVRHYSGMPIYLHRPTRVVTLSKPYALGNGITRRHDIPISAIPCLNYRKALEEEAKQQEIERKITEQIKNGTWKNNYMNAKNKINISNNNVNSSASDKVELKDNISDDKKINKKEDESKVTVKNVDIVSNLDGNNTNESKDKDIDKDSEITEQCIKNDNLVTETKHGTLDRNKPICPFSQTLVKINETDSKKNESDKLSNDKISIEMNANCNDNTEQKCPLASDKKDREVLNKINSDCDQIANESNQQVNANESLGKDNIDDTNKQITEDNGKKPEDSTNTKENSENDEDISSRLVVLPGDIPMLPPRVETVNTSWKTQHLTPEQFTDYCKALFKFKTVNIMHFQRWADRRKYTKARKTLLYPAPPAGTRLVTIPAQQQDDPGPGRNKRDWVMNMNGRSYLSVFHEYVRRALQKQPVYEFKQLENAQTPYQATVHIGSMQYGSGRGSSKRLAKAAAARASIQILMPGAAADEQGHADTDLSFFDYVNIEDPRIMEFCAASCEPSPHAILRTCLLRNFGAGDRHIHTEMKKLEFQKMELTMKVGKHSATVVCRNKKAAKQRASQVILQALHPHVRSWGSLLRLYGSRSVKSCKEKKLEEQQITLLQDKARHNAPNHAVLDKLRQEMLRLKERDAAVLPIGTLLLKDHLPTHSGSNLNNVDL